MNPYSLEIIMVLYVVFLFLKYIKSAGWPTDSCNSFYKNCSSHLVSANTGKWTYKSFSSIAKRKALWMVTRLKCFSNIRYWKNNFRTKQTVKAPIKKQYRYALHCSLFGMITDQVCFPWVRFCYKMAPSIKEDQCDSTLHGFLKMSELGFWVCKVSFCTIESITHPINPILPASPERPIVLIHTWPQTSKTNGDSMKKAEKSSIFCSETSYKVTWYQANIHSIDNNTALRYDEPSAIYFKAWKTVPFKR